MKTKKKIKKTSIIFSALENFLIFFSFKYNKNNKNLSVE